MRRALSLEHCPMCWHCVSSSGNTERENLLAEKAQQEQQKSNNEKP
jgi:hypothetical protein